MRSVGSLLVLIPTHILQLLFLRTGKGLIPVVGGPDDSLLNGLLAQAANPDFPFETSVHLKGAGMAPTSVRILLLLGHLASIIFRLCSNVHRRKPVKTHQRIKGLHYSTLDALNI